MEEVISWQSQLAVGKILLIDYLILIPDDCAGCKKLNYQPQRLEATAQGSAL